MRYVLALTAAVVALPHAAGAQGPQSFHAGGVGLEARADSAVTSVFLREPGLLVEGVGLERWTFQMIQDSLAVDAPGVAFWRQYCSDAYQRDLDIFPQSVAIQNQGDSAVTVFVAIIEPQDSALVTVRQFTGNPERSLAPWPTLVDLARTRLTVMQAGMVAGIHARAAGLTPALTRGTRADSVELTGLWTALATHGAAEEAATARHLLTTSPNVYDRLAAVAILSSFDQEDAAWHALVGALLDPNDLVREYARAVLRAFTVDFTRRIDWRPAAPELHALLQGSDLWSLNETLDMLVATGAGPELAKPLLKNGGHAVLLYAGAQNPWARGPAYRFLRAVSGKDLGGVPARWQDWIATL